MTVDTERTDVQIKRNSEEWSPQNWTGKGWLLVDFKIHSVVVRK